VERILGYKLERRTLPEFDYSVPAPTRDKEFARGSRPPQGQPRSQGTESRTGGSQQRKPLGPLPSVTGRPGDGPAQPAGTLRSSLTSGNRDLLASRKEPAPVSRRRAGLEPR
jgi:ATP-dependent RNA helicase RhlE